MGLDLPADRCSQPVAHRVHAFEPRGRLSDEELRAEYLHEMRWFTVDEVAALADPPRVVTAPRELAEFLAALARDGRPRAPYRLGV